MGGVGEKDKESEKTNEKKIIQNIIRTHYVVDVCVVSVSRISLSLVVGTQYADDTFALE